MLNTAGSVGRHEVALYRTFGFLVLRNWFTPSEMLTINAEYEKGLSWVRSLGLTGVGVRGQLNWSNLRPETPFLAHLPEDHRLLDTAESLLGGEVVAVHCNGNNFCGPQTEWHPDSDDPSLHALKFALYLQPLGDDNGALRVIPGSHQKGYSHALRELQLRGKNVGEDNSFLHQAGLRVNDIPAYVCRTNPGDVIVFDLGLWHGSSGGSTDRRLVSSDFHKVPNNSEEKKALESFLEGHRESRRVFRSPGAQYSDWWLENREDSEVRQRWITRLSSWGMLERLPDT